MKVEGWRDCWAGGVEGWRGVRGGGEEVEGRLRGLEGCEGWRGGCQGWRARHSTESNKMEVSEDSLN